jgi:transposase
VQLTPPVTDPTVQCVTPRQATWLTLRQPKDMTESEQHLLTRLHHAHAAFAQAITLAQGFAQLLRARQPDQLNEWLQQAATSSLAALQRLAKSFQRDYAAVKAGVTLPWSTSPVEGHINRLKMLKRQMFGRARLDLLSRRFLLAPRERQAQAVGLGAPSQVYAAAA